MTSPNRCVVPHHTTETGWISWGCPQQAHAELVFTWDSFPQMWPENNREWQASWWSIWANSEQTFSQTDQYYPRCSWKTGWVCTAMQTPKLLIHKAKSTGNLCFPQYVCQWPQPWPAGPPSLGLEVIFIGSSGHEWNLWSGGISDHDNYCISIDLARHDTKMTHQCSPISKVGALSIWYDKKKKKNRNGWPAMVAHASHPSP